MSDDLLDGLSTQELMREKAATEQLIEKATATSQSGALKLFQEKLARIERVLESRT